MKIYYILLSATLFLITTACEQKKPVQTEAPPTPAINLEQKSPEAVAPKNEANKELAKIEKADKVLPPKVENIDKKSPLAAKETTEQSLADISKHGREVTKSQESKTRTRAQIAEDEMQNDLKNFK